MNKFFLLTCCLFFCHFLTAQSLAISGVIEIEGVNPEGSKIIISKNGNNIDKQTINKKGHFELKLAFDSDYKLTFEKEGYVSKIVNVNTEVPAEILESNPNFPPIKMTVNLYPHVEEVDLSIFEQPIAILAYNQEVDDFKFDEDYSDKIKNRIAKAEQDIKHAIASKNAAAQEFARKFTELVSKGQQSFDQKGWNDAIGFWSQALEMKPENNDLKQKIASARQEADQETLRQKLAIQNEQAYKRLLGSADSLFALKHYKDAKEKYAAANRLNDKEGYPSNKIQEIDSILSALAKEEADKQKQLAETEAAYQKTITLANQAFYNKEYNKSITSYQQALTIKANENYPREMIAKAEQALAEVKKQEAAETERKRIEEERINSLKQKYAMLIKEADAAFKKGNYSLAKLRYNEADNLNLGEEYPKKQVQEIDKTINSSQYKTKLAEYNKNKTLAQKNMIQKNYAGAKVYYQKALSILSVDKETIEQQIEEIDQLIEAARLAEMEKEYKQHIEKADKAYREKAYAVARFYYKKALEIKIDDKYASERLREVEQNIGKRQEKGIEL